MSSEIQIGSTVRLNGGGPVMTVTSIGKLYEDGSEIYAWCTWFKNSNETETKHFPIEAVVLAAPQ